MISDRPSSDARRAGWHDDARLHAAHSPHGWRAGWCSRSHLTGVAAAAGERRRALAIKGYDPVAYFTPGKPTPGSPDISYEWDGARWQFADAAHRELFQSDPDAYAPQYGGYCALGMTTGNRGETNPEVWAIVDGKLYLNYDKSAHGRVAAEPGRQHRPGRRAMGQAEAVSRKVVQLTASVWHGRLLGGYAQPLSFFAISATCLPWKRAMPSSCSDGCRSPWPPAMVVAPYGEPPLISSRPICAWQA